MRPRNVKSGPRAGGIIDKGEVMGIVQELWGRGLGSDTIAGMIGYHPTTVKHYNKLLGLAPMTTAERVRRIISNMPAELAERAESIRRRANMLDGIKGVSVAATDDPLRKRWSATDVTDTSKQGIGVL